MRWGRSVFPTRRPRAISAGGLTTAIEALQTAINETRVRVWRAQPAPFFDEAVIDADGTLAETTGACKGGMDISYEGVWGYHLDRLAGEHAGAVVLDQSKRQSPVVGRRRRAVRSSARAVPGCGVSPDHLPRRHGFQPDRPSGSVGHRRRAAYLRVRCARESHSRGRRPADPRVDAVGAAPAVRGADRAAATAGERERGHHRRAGVQEFSPDGRGRGRVCLPTDGVYEAVPHGGGAEEHIRRARRPAAVRRDSLLLLSHESITRPRRPTWSVESSGAIHFLPHERSLSGLGGERVEAISVPGSRRRGRRVAHPATSRSRFGSRS